VSDPATGRLTVLVVDDEESVADTYALHLQSAYETRTAYGGEEALEVIDGEVDAVLLDRRMPDLSGDEVLERIREAGYDCTVVMITAVDADLNILEMDFDDYLSKPITRETLLETLDQHLAREDRENERLDEFFRLVSKLSVLEAELTRAELQDSEEYGRLRRRAEALGDNLRQSVEDFDEIVATYRDIDRGP
jgi:DNA-binding response OmpR family regulator